MTQWENVKKKHGLITAKLIVSIHWSEIWSIKYAFDLDTIVRHKDELTSLGYFILINTLLNKTNMK
jgi:hypothetical protein